MAKLKTILDGVKVLYSSNPEDVAVSGIQIDSRLIEKGNCFVAIKGIVVDGHDFIDVAIEKGATVIICQHLPEGAGPKIKVVQVKNAAIAAGIMAHNFYGKVTRKLKLVGVTGTNGKTTVATLLYNLFSSLGYTCGLLSTVQNKIGNSVLASAYTTPDPVSLNKLLAEMAAKKCTHVFMEVSSHALHQHRVSGLHFTGAIFTNITHDHLDYHRTFENYIKAKKSFFDGLDSSAFSITNADDKRGLVMLQNTKAKKYVYSLKNMADFKGRVLDNSMLGLHMMVNDVEIHFRLIGAFNAYNLLAVYGAALCLGENKEQVLQQLSMLEGAEGRFDPIISPRERVMGIIDYAHTPDALLNVLATLKNLRTGTQKIITVIGCGGNRDKTKRPEMAQVACEYSDRVFLTSDNPRMEEPEQIIKDMEAGVPVTARRKSISITDRKEAIKAAVAFADREDIVLVAGKGHEKYQDVKGEKKSFDDKKILAEMFELMKK